HRYAVSSLMDSVYRMLEQQKCRSPVCWSEVGDSQLTGPEMIRETTVKIGQINNHFIVARSRQKSYADVRRRLLEFNVGDKVMLKSWSSGIQVSAANRAPRDSQHFHVSNLKKCLSDKSLIIPLKEVQLDDNLYFIEEPVEIMDREVKQLKQSCIPIAKVHWNSRRGPEFTLEREDQIKSKYPHHFTSKPRVDKAN
ncbi:hypothetical protein Tco_0180985, partial [Tanacetum coccineum]